MGNITSTWTNVPRIQFSRCDIPNPLNIKFILHRRVEESTLCLERKVEPIYTGLLLRKTKARLSQASNLQSGWWAEYSELCSTPRLLLCPLAHYPRVPEGQFQAQSNWRGALLQDWIAHFHKAGPTESDSPRCSLSSGPWVGLCGRSEILGGRPFCAFPSHFPGADGVLKLWMQCPSFQAPTVSVERMLRLKESVG